MPWEGYAVWEGYTAWAGDAAGDGGAEVGLEMAQTLLEQAEPLVHGTYIMPSFGRYAQAAELVRRIRDRQAARVSRATSAG